MHPDVKKLLEVQKVDQEIARISRDLKSLPEEESRRSKRLAQLKASHEAAVVALQSAEVESREMELGIKQSDEEIEKLRVRLNTVKNNAEYQATLLQMESVKTERGRLEERGLVVLEQLDGLRAAAEQAETALAEEQRVYDQFCEESAKLRAEREAQVAEVRVGRDALLEGIPRELLERYESLFGVRDSAAIAPVENQFCMGCYTSVTTNDVANLMAGSMVVQCGSCQRILYIPAPE